MAENKRIKLKDSSENLLIPYLLGHNGTNDWEATAGADNRFIYLSSGILKASAANVGTNTSTSHKYIYLSGGVFTEGSDIEDVKVKNATSADIATTATKLANTTAIGGNTQPVFFNASGQPAVVTTMAVAYGGTGKNSWTANQLIYASDANTLEQVTGGSNGQVLKLVNSKPAWSADTDTKNTVGATTTSSIAAYPIITTATGDNPRSYAHSVITFTADDKISAKGFILDNATSNDLLQAGGGSIAPASLTVGNASKLNNQAASYYATATALTALSTRVSNLETNVSSALHYKNAVDCSSATSASNTLIPDTGAVGDTYKISKAGYFGNVKVEAGDMVICYTAYTTKPAAANVLNNWNIIQNNIDLATPDTAGYVKVGTNLAMNNDGKLGISMASSATSVAVTQTPSFNNTFNIINSISQAADGKITVTTSTVKIPQQTSLSGGFTAVAGKYVSGVNVSEHTVTVTTNTLPAANVTSHLGLSTASTTANVTLSTAANDPWITLKEDNTVDSGIQFKGAAPIKVSGNGSVVTISHGTALADSATVGLSADSTATAATKSINVPYITVDANGHVTSAVNHSVTIPAEPTDANVKQTVTSTAGNYPLIFKGTTATATVTAGVGFDADATYNPNTNTLNVGNIMIKTSLKLNLSSADANTLMNVTTYNTTADVSIADILKSMASRIAAVETKTSGNITYWTN